MALEDLDLRETDGGYELAAPVTDETTRLRNRFRVQMLSCFRSVTFRGCELVSQLEARRVKTNADIIGLFALSVGRIIPKMRTYAQDVYPIRVSLNDFEFLDGRRLLVDFSITGSEGTVSEQLIVEGLT